MARGLVEQYPGGVWWVDLAPLSEQGLVPQAVALALGLVEEGGQPLLEALQERLEGQRLLLVLDNCEHLLGACGELAESLLTACPQLVLLATSREAPLGVPGETGFLLAGLTLPSDEPALTPAELQRSEAVQLFLARAVAVRRNFALTAENADAVGRICVGLDGLPLALELAAARLNVFTVEELAERLDERFRLLRGGGRRAVPRHQTLEAAIDWSYQLLTDPERVLLRRLSVFAGGFTLEATEKVCFAGEIEEGHPLALLTHLVDKCLVLMYPAAGRPRYRLLETIRQFGWERLQKTGEAEAVQEAHARYFAALSEATSLRTEPDYGQLAREIANIRAALRWLDTAAETAERPLAGGELLDLSAAYAACCFQYGQLTEGREWTGYVLDLPAAAQRVRARAWLLLRAGLLYFSADFPRARIYLEEGVAIARELDDRRILALALSVLSFVVHDQDGPAAAAVIAEEALSAARALGDKQVLLSVLDQVGRMLHSAADDPRCRVVWEEYLAIARELNDQGRIAAGLEWTGIAVNFIEGNYPLARAHVEEGRAILERLKAKQALGVAIKHIALVLFVQGQLGRARQAAAQSARLHREMGQKHWLAYCLPFLGLIVHSQGEVETALPLAEEAVALGRELGGGGDRMALAWSLWCSGRVFSSTDPGRARSCLLESLSLLGRLSAAGETGWTLHYLGWLALKQHDAEALTFAEQALRLSQERNYPHVGGWARMLQAEWARQCGENERATELYDRAEEIFRRLGADGDLALVWLKRGWLAEALGDRSRAASLYWQSLAHARPGDSRAILSADLLSLARLALSSGRAEWAAQRIGAADALKVELVWSLPGEIECYQQDRSAIRRQLGQNAFEANLAEGQEMQPEQVNALADRVVRLAARLAPASPGTVRPSLVLPAAPLSPRELEVLSLMVQRMTDAEIGRRLVVSPRTISTHLSSIYRKLGVGSRIEAARAAREFQLL